MTLTFERVLSGSYPERSVRTRWSNQRENNPVEVERLIAESWTSAETEAAARGRDLYPGPMTRLLGWTADDETLTLDLGPTDYREFVGTNLRHPELAERFGREALANPLGVSVAVVTADGQFVVQRRSEHVFEYPGFLHVCGGNVEPADVAGPDAPGVFAAARRELDEEMRVGPEQIVTLRCLGLAENRESFKPDLLFEAELTLPADTVREATNAEYTGLVLVDGEVALASCLVENRDRFSPAGMACLLAVGRRRYGEGWYSDLSQTITSKAPHLPTWDSPTQARRPAH